LEQGAVATREIPAAARTRSGCASVTVLVTSAAVMMINRFIMGTPLSR
jgi:hypothetical protein